MWACEVNASCVPLSPQQRALCEDLFQLLWVWEGVSEGSCCPCCPAHRWPRVWRNGEHRWGVLWLLDPEVMPRKLGRRVRGDVESLAELLERLSSLKDDLAHRGQVVWVDVALCYGTRLGLRNDLAGRVAVQYRRC